MAGSPIKRAKREAAQALGEQTSPQMQTPNFGDVSLEEIKKIKEEFGYKSPEFMDALARRRKALGKTDPSKLGGRPRTRFSKEEVTDHALTRLEPKALKVLEKQLSSPDERVRQSAAIKILEWKRGKPGQTVKVDSDAVHTIKYETIAFGNVPPKQDFELLPGDIIEEEDETDEDA